MTLALLATLLGGLAVGWLIAVPVHRFREDDEGEGYAVVGTAECRHCATPVLPSDVPPVRSWFGPGRACRTCGTDREWSWIAVQAAVPVFAAITVLTLGEYRSIIAYLWLVPVLVALSVIDLRCMLLPRQIIWPATGVALAIMVGLSLWVDDWSSLRSALIGAVAYAGILTFVGLVSAVVGPMGLGLGDLRLGVLLGLYLGWTAWRLIIVAPLLGSLIGLAQGLIALAITRRKEPFPFGPALAMGTLVALWFHQPILSWMNG